MESLAENPTGSGVKTLDLDAEMKAKLLAQALGNHESANAARSKWLQDKEEGLNLYWGIRKSKDFPFKNCANLHVPLIRTIADTLHSNIMGSIDTEKPISIMPVGPEDVPKARRVEKVLNWQLSTQVDYNDLVDKISQSTLIYGIAPVKVRYVIDKDVKGKVRFDGVKINVVHPERILIPSDAPTIDVEDMEFIMQEIPMSKSDLKKRIASKSFDKIPEDELDKIGILASQASRSDEDYLENVRSFYTGMETDHAEDKIDKRYVTVIEWYGHFDYNGDGIDEPVMAYILKENKRILRAVPWERRRPFVIVAFSEVLHKATGESLPDLLKDINRELDTLHNQRVDAVTIANIPPFFFDPVGGFNPNEIVLTPGTGIPTNGRPQDAVYFPTLNTVRPEMYQEEEQLYQYAERMLGAGANVQGVMNTKRVTATEIATTDRRSGIRFLTIFNRIRKGLKEIARLVLELDEEYMPKEIQVRVTGLGSEQPIFETISRDDLGAQVDIMVRGNSILDEQAEKSEMMQAYQIGIMNPLISSDPIAIYELTRDLFLKLNIKRVDSYLRQPMDEIPKTPDEEHNLFMQEEYVEPNIRENYEDHLAKHAEVINNSDKFDLLSNVAKNNLMRHYSDTMRMKQQIELFQMMQKASAVNGALMQSQMTGDIVPEALGMPQTPTGPQEKPKNARNNRPPQPGS